MTAGETVLVPDLAEARLTLALFGVDANGRIVSRGTTYVRSDFASQATPFAVELTPIGRETRFELRVLDYSLPLLNGIEVTRQIKRRVPSVEVLIFTMHDNDTLVSEPVQAFAAAPDASRCSIRIPRSSRS